MGNDYIKRINEMNVYGAYLDEVESEMKSNSDRAIALICSSVLEEVLKDLLKSFLLHSDKIDNELFSGNNTLSTMESRKMMAFYLGLITEEELKNITYIQRVRNRFAHQIVDITFENQDIANICSNLKTPKDSFIPRIIPFPKKDSDGFPKVDLNPLKGDTSPKDRFVLTYEYLFRVLSIRTVLGDFKKVTELKKVDNAEEFIVKQIEAYEKILDEKAFKLKNTEVRLQKIKESKECDSEILTKVDDIEKELVELRQEFEDSEEVKVIKQLIKLHTYTLEVVKNSMK